MPRDGSGIYNQPSPNVEEGTPIESAVYNLLVADVAFDLNDERPILAGGTGAASASDALFNLGAEKAAQLVTNYNSHIWSPGSFYSTNASGAGAPIDGHAFAGVCYINEALAQPPTNANVVIEARDLDDAVTPGQRFVREKKAGAWSSWYADGFQVFGGNVGISSSGADMFAGFSSTPQAFIVNSESDVSGTDLLRVFKTGSVQVKNPDGNAHFGLMKTASGNTADIASYTNNAARWVMRMSSEAAETGSNAGSDFHLFRINDAGTVFNNVMSVSRASGLVTFPDPGGVSISGSNGLNVGGAFSVSGGAAFPGGVTGGLSVTGALSANQLSGVSPGSSWQLRLSDSTSGTNKYLRCFSNNFEIINNAFSAGLFSVADDATVRTYNTIIADAASATQLRLRATNYSVIHRNDNATYYILLTNNGDTDGTWNTLRPFRVDLSSGNVTMDHNVNVGGALSCSGTSSLGTVIATGHISQAAGAGAYVFSNGYACKPGTGGGYRTAEGYYYVIDYNGTNAGLYIGGTLLGLFSYISDYRAKKDVAELPGMWDRVKALNPIKYTQKEFSPPSHLASNEQMKAKAKEAKEGTPEANFVEGPLLKADNVERWGFMAHELQTTLTDSAASCPKDDPNAVQSPNPWTVIAALTKALQEAMARIEEMEVRIDELESPV